MDKIQYHGIINYLRAIKTDLGRIANALSDSKIEPQPVSDLSQTDDRITYTLNCRFCGKVIYRKDAFDNVCDEHISSQPED